MKSCPNFGMAFGRIAEIIRSHPLVQAQRGSLDPIFRIRRRLRHVSLYIILVLCPAAGVPVEIQRFVRDKFNPKKIFFFPVHSG